MKKSNLLENFYKLVIIKSRILLLGRWAQGKLIFDKIYHQIQRESRETFFPFYGLHSESLKEILAVKDELIKEFEKGYDKEFNKALLLLLSRSIQHIESIFLLTERGLYGDAFILLRGVLSDINMIYYLHFNPHLVSGFIKESDTSYQQDSDFKKSFSEAAIDYDLKKHGVKSIKDSFQKLSKAAHASAWGAQFYGTAGKSGTERQKFFVKYGPGFEAKKILALFGMTVSAHWDFLNIILWHRYHKNLDIDSVFWMDIRNRVRQLKPKILSLSKLGEELLIEFDTEKEHDGLE